MSVCTLKNLVRNNWTSITKNVKKLSPYHELCYHYKRKNLNLLAFDGYNHSKDLCLSVYDLLNKNNIKCDIIKCYSNNIYNNEHMYIKLNNKIIIDPTYKQFLRESRGYNDV